MQQATVLYLQLPGLFHCKNGYYVNTLVLNFCFCFNNKDDVSNGNFYASTSGINDDF